MTTENTTKKRFKRLRQGTAKLGSGAKKLRHPIIHVKAAREARKNVTTKVVVPYITNETVAEHREQVLKGARKYIYPLQHSKHRIVVISTSIFIASVIALLTYSALALYKFQSTSTFVYRITQVLPFPIARVEGDMVSYESYLFELRHYIHYYETQQKLSFKTPEGQQQLDDYKKRALESVVDSAYIKKLAKENNVSISSREVDAQIAIVREQNRLGTSSQVFEDVLRDFWGWSLQDFKRSLRQQMLTRKVVSKLDIGAHAKINAAQTELSNGVSFADVAKKYSMEQSTKDTGGEYSGLIDKSNRDISALVTAAIFSLKPGEVSGIIDTGYTLEIVKLNGLEGDKARASHIQVNLKNVDDFLKPLKDKHKARLYIKA